MARPLCYGYSYLPLLIKRLNGIEQSSVLTTTLLSEQSIGVQTLERWLTRPWRPQWLKTGQAKDESLMNMSTSFHVNRIRAYPGAHYTNQLRHYLFTLSPYVSGPRLVKVLTPLSDFMPGAGISTRPGQPLWDGFWLRHRCALERGDEAEECPLAARAPSRLS